MFELKIASGNNISDSYSITRKEYLFLLPFFLFYTLITLLASRNPFFWDKDIIFSRIADWLMENKFSPVLPDALDVGYPPLLGYLLALAWKITGKSLLVMHLFMLPFSIGIVIQLYRFLRHYMLQQFIIPVMILVLADTSLLAQSIVFSTDLVMIFFLLLAINSVLYDKRTILSVAIFGLLFSHMRGAMGMAVIGLFDLYKNRYWEKPLKKFSIAYPYLPGIVLFGTYCIFHYAIKGWIGYHENSPWIGCFEVVDGKGFLKNILIVAWRLVDFGKLFLFPILFYLIFRFLKYKYAIDQALADLFVLLGLSVLAFVPSALIYKVLSSHRYFLPITMIITIITGYMLFFLVREKKLRNGLYILMLAGLLSGSFWTYPDTIAKGWDATLAHIPYYGLRNKMLAYIDDHQISFSDIGTEVPNSYRLKYYDLSDDERYIPIKDFERNRYIFYSNICNTFSDQEIMQLKNHWIIEKEFRCLLVRVTLYKNPEYTP
ncbi:MAG: hypothetical protein A2Y71_05820 [Bacteroidetes bacterium RBG_13_42_15]|nr:MAG: hypothetical protein A2Y71_05820 [Bacteroidetes bacterium RBG_13_42_15]